MDSSNPFQTGGSKLKNAEGRLTGEGDNEYESTEYGEDEDPEVEKQIQKYLYFTNDIHTVMAFRKMRYLKQAFKKHFKGTEKLKKPLGNWKLKDFKRNTVDEKDPTDADLANSYWDTNENEWSTQLSDDNDTSEQLGSDNKAVEDKPENPKPTTSKQKKKPPVTRIVSDDDESDYEKPTAEDNEFIDDSMAECAADREAEKALKQIVTKRKALIEDDADEENEETQPEPPKKKKTPVKAVDAAAVESDDDDDDDDDDEREDD
ncbi:hypothetical protein OS493_001876 [Desmophyllum pertusum]|uniref:Uncharacterized protein n=1 Tax=Desmophyllum pertusum TaxID=174260 RepID=A0A9W9Z4G8_9CNID|nr:hypothetical protein OS493_001876 [Desmophyllum pertusum]